MEILEEELYYSVIGIIAYVVMTGIAFKVYAKDRGKAMLFFSLSWLFNTIYPLIETLSYIMLNDMMWKMAHTLLSISFLFWMTFLDYAFSDEISWKRFTIGAAYFAVFSFYMWIPSTTIILSNGYDMETMQTTYIYTINNPEIFAFLYDAYVLLFGISLLYWTIKTYSAIPEDRKNNGKMTVIAGVFLLSAGVVFPIIDFNLIPEIVDILDIMSYIIFLGSGILLTVAIYRYSMIIHLLPYKVFRLLVMSKNGNPYIEYRWSEHKIETVLLSGLFSAVGTFTKAVTEDINSGLIREMKLQNGIFLLVPQYSPVTFGLLASKSSMDLKKSLDDFSAEFVKKYYDELYTGDGFPKEIRVNPSTVFIEKNVIDLVMKHFPNVPNYVQSGLTTEELVLDIMNKEKEALETSNSAESV